MARGSSGGMRDTGIPSFVLAYAVIVPSRLDCGAGRRPRARARAHDRADELAVQPAQQPRRHALQRRGAVAVGRVVGGQDRHRDAQAVAG